MSAVLKLAETRDWTSQVLRAERAVSRIRAAGYPTPAWTRVGQTATGIGYQIQELVDGRAVDVIGVPEARELIRVLELQRGLDPDPGRCWSDFLAQEVTSGLPALRSAAAAAADAGPDLVTACDRVLEPIDGQICWPRTDMVHGDFRMANVLFQSGAIVGVIDIEAIGSGTRVFDYATLLDHSQIDAAALELLVQTAVDIAGPDVLRACFARVALDLARFMAAAARPGKDDQLTTRVEELANRVDEVDRLSRR
jgi:aminoglycoside phosphotransferase (APT) family kinase protein